MIRTHRKITRRKKHFDWRIAAVLGALVFALVAWPGPLICRDYRERSLLRRIDALLLDMASDDETLSSQAVEQLSLCSGGESLRTLLAKLSEREERADSEWERIDSRLDNVWRGIGVDALDELEGYLRAEGAGYSNDFAPQAGRALGAIGEPALPVLTMVLSAGAGAAKRYAAEGLARTSLADALEPLVLATADADPGVRGAAVRALGRMATPGAVTELERIFSAGTQAAGWAAIELAAMNGSRKPMDYLAVALKDQDGAVRAAAARPLARMGDEAAMNALSSMLSDRDAYVRRSAATALGDIPDEKAALAAAAALTDVDRGVREAAIAAIRSAGRPESLQKYFTAALSAADPADRRRAAAGLGALKDPMAILLLVGSTADDDESVRIAAVHALGEIGDERATQPLTRVLDSSTGKTYIAVVEALGKIGDPRCVNALIQIISKEDYRFAQSPELEKVLLEALLRTKTELGRQAAAEYVRKKKAAAGKNR